MRCIKNGHSAFGYGRDLWRSVNEVNLNVIITSKT